MAPRRRSTKAEAQETARQILQLEREGFTYREIGERMNVSFQYVSRVLKAHGINKPPGFPTRLARVERDYRRV